MIATTLWLRAFVLTVVIEEAVAIPLLASVETSVGRRIGAVFLANIATHPLVWFFFPHLGWPRAWVLWSSESWAFSFEVLAYRIIFPAAPLKRCTAVSIAANFASLGIGLVAIRFGFFG